ncbi:MAG TPA: M56 family metallopeptidase [Terriglobia bacterium]|nr:M56 family metallopeptidase [Terriglobia bacterium]
MMSELGISAEWLQRLAGSLLHFVWQGAILALAAAILLRILARRPASWRYITAVIFLGLMLLAPCATIIFYPETGAAALRVLQIFRASIADGGGSVDSAAVLRWTGWIVLAWATGVTACSLRLIIGWFLSLRLIRSSKSQVPQAVERLLGRVHSALLTTRRMPRLLVGERVTGPVVFGWLRPVVLLPVSAVTGLTEEQLLAVLAHELAHVRRYDFLVNALQRGVESVLFYHPGVWWLSSRIRKEREHCCDDLAVRVCGDRFAYAKALIELEKMRSERLALAVSATGSLTERIRRMLGAEDRNRDWQPAMAALLLLGICTVAGLWHGDAFVLPAFAAVPPAPVLAPIVEQPEVPSTAPVESALAALEAIATAQTPQPAARAGERWITTWGVAMLPPNVGFTEVQCCNNQTVRMFMRVSAGGTSVRLRLSNANGSAPLFLGQVRVSLHDRGSEIVSGSDRQVFFSGKPSVEIPIGQTVTSDPVNLDVPAQADVSVSIYAPNETGKVTGVSSFRNGYVVAGDQARSTGLMGANLTKGRYWVSGIEVLAPASSGAIVVVADGDIEMESDGGRSWPDFLALRVQNNNTTKAQGVVLIGEAYRLMEGAFSAFNRIVASQNGVRYLMLCPSFPMLASFGLTSSGLSPEVRITQKLNLTIEEARKGGISIIGCTLPPGRLRSGMIVGMGGLDGEFKDEKGQLRKVDSVRVAVNDWMKSSGVFDALVDLDAVTRDPANPSTLKPEFRISNDPPTNVANERAHQAIADAIDLSLFTR